MNSRFNDSFFQDLFRKGEVFHLPSSKYVLACRGYQLIQKRQFRKNKSALIVRNDDFDEERKVFNLSIITASNVPYCTAIQDDVRLRRCSDFLWPSPFLSLSPILHSATSKHHWSTAEQPPVAQGRVSSSR